MQRRSSTAAYVYLGRQNLGKQPQQQRARSALLEITQYDKMAQYSRMAFCPVAALELFTV